MDNMTNGSISIDSEIIETVIGANTKFKGQVKTDKVIRIDGDFEGTIDSTSLVIISEIGKFKGDLKCHTCQLFGHGEGTAVCSELFKFASTGVFTGEVETKNIVLVEGSLLDGTIKMAHLR